jgi:hypothetical protein
MRNWKTTAAGVASILSIVVKLLQGGGLEQSDIVAAVAGVGFLFAKDGDVTGGTRRQ